MATGFLKQRYENTSPTPLETESPFLTRWPKLSEKHLLTVFFNSGITLNDVKTLRTLLKLPHKELLSRSAPFCAMETILEWRDSQPSLSTKEAHKILAKRLKQIKLNAAIPLLQGKKRRTVVDPQKMTDFLAESSQNFTMEQARTFGRHLTKYLGKSMEDMKADTGMGLVLEIFDNMNRITTNIHVDLISDVIEALGNAAEWNLTPLNAGISDQVVVTDGNEIVSPENTSQTVEVENMTQPSQKHKLKKFILAIFLVIEATALITFTTGFVCLFFLPSFPTATPKQTILPNDVVLFKIPLSYWLTHISIELQGPFITDCFADVISIKCEHAIQNRNASIISGNDLDYLYIEKEGMIMFTVDNSSEGFTTRYYAWIFTTFQSAMSNSSNDFKNLACGRPPENVWCVDFAEIEEYDFILPKSSYYFIRCNNRDHNCNQVDISINSSRYDFNSSKQYQIDSTLIHSQEIEQSIHLRPNFKLGFQDEKNCLLMKLSPQCSNGNPSIYQVAITGIKRRYDILLYPSIAIILILLILGFTGIGYKIVKKCSLKLRHKSKNFKVNLYNERELPEGNRPRSITTDDNFPLLPNEENEEIEQIRPQSTYL